MNIEQKLKKITLKMVDKQNADVNNIEMPKALLKWINEYKKIGGDRGDFIWKWLLTLNRVFVCSSVEKEYRESLISNKFLFNMFIILIDDASENINNRKFLDELLKVPFRRDEIKTNKLSENEKKYLNFTIKVWGEIDEFIKKYPNYKEYREIYEFDIEQLLMSVKFGYLVYNHSCMINEEEFWSHIPWSMQIVIDFDMDLMCMSKLEKDELRTFREISIYAQKMGRIGNWISTWERELFDNDFTSLVFPYALKKDIITLKDLDSLGKKEKIEIAKKIKKINSEEYLLGKWDSYYLKIKQFDKKLETINVNDILEVLEYLISMHVMSRGFK